MNNYPKSLGFAISLLMLSCVAIAAGESCYQIQNAESKNFCLATAKGDPNYCYQISNSDYKNTCLAVTKGEKNYCYQISNSDTKNQCLGKF
jgi:hypothetical protein